MHVYLRQGAQAAKDWVRQRGYLVAVKVKSPVGRREEAVRLTLFRHRSAFDCTSVRVYLKKQPRQSSTHTTMGIDTQMQGTCI
jgi:hypothetical protein